jgi:formylglycine-generating enzyme required for sulfatase activity
MTNSAVLEAAYTISGGSGGGGPAGDETTVIIGGIPGFDMRYVPPTPAGGFQRDGTAANITIISQGYWMGETEVTQELFQAVMGTNPSYFSGSPADGETQGRRPTEQVNWYAAIAFCNKLSLLDGKTPVYKVSGVSDWAALAYSAIPASGNPAWDAVTREVAANGYRLPTEMQWLWAAIGATAGGANVTTTGWNKGYAGSTEGAGLVNVNNYAWYGANSGAKTHEAGKKTANELGLYDMSGNVLEWCWDWDWQTAYPDGTLTDPVGAFAGADRVARGESWSANSAFLRPDYRHHYIPSEQGYIVGFRLVCP